MALILNKILSINSTPAHRTFESMGEGLLLVEIDFGRESLSPYHWFLESGEKPPLDVSINPNTGALSSISFFFQNEKLSKNPVKFMFLKKQIGIPSFDISMFSENKYQVFEKGKVVTHINNNNLYFVFPKYFSPDKPINLCLDISKNVSLFFDSHGAFIGFVLKKILESETAALQLSALIRIK